MRLLEQFAPREYWHCLFRKSLVPEVWLFPAVTFQAAERNNSPTLFQAMPQVNWVDKYRHLIPFFRTFGNVATSAKCVIVDLEKGKHKVQF